MKINAFSQAKLIKLLLVGDSTCKELAAATGLHYVTVLEYTRELYRAKALYIRRWEQDELGRHCIKVYKLGFHTDTKRPKMTDAEKQSACRERKAKWKVGSSLQKVITNV